MSDGATIEEAITNGIDAMRGWIEAVRAEGHAVPAPTRSAAAWADRRCRLLIERLGHILLGFFQVSLEKRNFFLDRPGAHPT